MRKRPSAVTRRLLLVALLAIYVALASASSAAAHAPLVSSDPAPGSVLPELHRVVLHFGEEVEAAGSHLWVEDATHAIDLGSAHHPGGDAKALEVAIPTLPTGQYLLGYHVVASDGDPEVGGLPFTISTLAPAVGAAPVAPTSTPLTGAVHRHGDDLPAGTARVLLDASLATLVGGLAFVATVWPSGLASSRARRLLWGATIAAAFTSTVLAVVQHATAEGLSVTQALSPSHLRDILHYRFGRVALARLVLLTNSGLLMTRMRTLRHGSRGAMAWWAVLSAIAFGLFETVVLLGHHGEAGGVAGLARLVHTIGVSAWLGGLVMLTAVVLPRRQRDELVRVLPRFSRLATVAVGAVVAAGLILSITLVGGLPALITTGYGRLLLAKLAVVVALLLIASKSRAHVRRSLLQSQDGIARPLATWVTVELGLMTAVFALTALLVSQAPPV